MPEALVLQEGAVSLLLLTENMLTEVFFKSHQGKSMDVVCVNLNLR